MEPVEGGSMSQQTVAGFEKYGKTTRRVQFLAEMERVVPWAEIAAVIEPHYPKPGAEGGRPPIALEKMLRIYFLQAWFNLSDPAVEEALYDSAARRAFVGIDLAVEPAPDETTVCKFRHRLEKHGLGKQIFAAVNRYLQENGLKVSTGTIVDATIISAPSSTKNRSGERDPEMHQTAKGKQWYFGMKAHLAIDSKTKLIHTILASAANVHDREALPHLLHGQETRVWGDQGYQGQTAIIRRRAPKARDFTNRRYRYAGQVNAIEKAKNRSKSQVRAKVEHVIGVIKRVFGFAEGALSGPGEESASPRGHRGARQPLHRAPATARDVGVVSMNSANHPERTRKRAPLQDSAA
jgi:IS5 family transposase